MTGPSENALLLTLGLSTVATVAGIWWANRALPVDPATPPELTLGPSVPAKALHRACRLVRAVVERAGRVDT